MSTDWTRMGRRAFLRDGSLLLLGTSAVVARAAEETSRKLRVGMVTDLHHADKPARGSRHYRDTLGKLAEASRQFATDKPDFVVELGDFIDAADTVETELGYLNQVHAAFAAIAAPKHHVLGNHCVDMLTKDEFLGAVGKQESYYSFDAGGVHCVVLDACFRADGKPYGRKNSQWTDANLPAAELDWLRDDLKRTELKTIVFAHQRLDDAKQHAVRNASAVREILEQSRKVLAVFQGHSHKNDLQDIAGIHYCTLVAMVEGAGLENSGFATLDVLADHSLRITGFRKQVNYVWK